MQISDAEWQVMKIIWMQGEQTSTDLIRVLAERFDWSKSTIQTLWARLVEKECLTRKKEGESFVHSALNSGSKPRLACPRYQGQVFVLVGLRTCWLI